MLLFRQRTAQVLLSVGQSRGRNFAKADHLLTLERDCGRRRSAVPWTPSLEVLPVDALEVAALRRLLGPEVLLVGGLGRRCCRRGPGGGLCLARRQSQRGWTARAWVGRETLGRGWRTLGPWALVL